MNNKQIKQFLIRFLKSLPNNTYQKVKKQVNIKQMCDCRCYRGKNELSIIQDIITSYLSRYVEWTSIYRMEDIYIKFKRNKTKKEILNEFLLKNNAYDAFYENIKNIYCKLEGYELHTNIDEYITKTKFRALILFAFAWKKTPQGHNFWDDLSSSFEYQADKFMANL